MGQEIEVKYHVDDPRPVRARLQSGDAERVTRVLETNWIFDTPERTLLAADRGLRLRTGRRLDDDRPVTPTLTYKGPRAASEMKTREEIETTVGDPPSVTTLLRRLGFDPAVIYEKRRETWRLGECNVCLDELPKLGWFVEVEGPSTEVIDAALAQLDLSAQVPLRETYVELAARHGVQDAAGIRRLVF
jgi:adenylate cyclase class 2